MALDFDAIGNSTQPAKISWTSDRALLYAVGVGAGQEDPLKELQFTTENCEGITQQVLPTFSVMLGSSTPNLPMVMYGDIDRSKLLHGQQSIRLHRPIPVQGEGMQTMTLTGIYDKGSGALVLRTTSVTDLEGNLIVECVNGSFIRGEGGFGGPTVPETEWIMPTRPADHVIHQKTREDQALIYRLSGDRNPLHNDPSFAARAGYSVPILHGLCSFGFVGRALLHVTCGSDVSNFQAMSARFSKPVLPGQTLSTSMWVSDGNVQFQTKVGDSVVLDRGTAEVSS